MNINIRIAGPAGSGVNSTVDIITELFADLGYDLITDIEYESRIKGGINFFDVNISNTQDKFLTKKVDIILAFNDECLIKQIPSLSKKSTIIINEKWVKKIEKNHTFLSQFHVQHIQIDDKYDNMYLLGVLIKFLKLDQKIILSKITKIFAKKGPDIVEKNTKIIQHIFEKFDIKDYFDTEIKQVSQSKNLSYGNNALIQGAIKGGLGYYSGYPMTPASSILTEIINYGKVPYLQAEDEIAVANSVLGASFTGVRAMCGTSGGGFALMSEAISFSVQSEIPMTIVLSQRAGPSTGTPTFTEQGDINYALNPSFGDFRHIVLCPTTLEEAHYFGCLALNIADKYQTQVIILMDKQSSELVGTHNNLIIPKIDTGVMLQTPPKDYKRYELTPTGVSPRVPIGTKDGDFIATSYEHDEYGATSENPENKQQFTEKRFKKLEKFFEKEGYKGYEIINKKAKKMIVTMSFTSYTAQYFIKNNPDFGLILIKFLKPIDENILKDIHGVEELIFVEQNYSGQLENLLVKELGLKYIKGLKISHLRKYNLMPFYIEDFEAII